jgi:hypothetical protein
MPIRPEEYGSQPDSKSILGIADALYISPSLAIAEVAPAAMSRM